MEQRGSDVHSMRSSLRSVGCCVQRDNPVPTLFIWQSNKYQLTSVWPLTISPGDLNLKPLLNLKQTAYAVLSN